MAHFVILHDSMAFTNRREDQEISVNLDEVERIEPELKGTGSFLTMKTRGWQAPRYIHVQESPREIARLTGRDVSVGR
jgi:hypothetical protein